jgi:hypothetical protein
MLRLLPAALVLWLLRRKLTLGDTDRAAHGMWRQLRQITAVAHLQTSIEAVTVVSLCQSHNIRRRFRSTVL